MPVHAGEGLGQQQSLRGSVAMFNALSILILEDWATHVNLSITLRAASSSHDCFATGLPSHNSFGREISQIMASFATEDESVADLFIQPNFWKSSTLLDSPAPIAKDFFDLSDTSE